MKKELFKRTIFVIQKKKNFIHFDHKRRNKQFPLLETQKRGKKTRGEKTCVKKKRNRKHFIFC